MLKRRKGRFLATKGHKEHKIDWETVAKGFVLIRDRQKRRNQVQKDFLVTVHVSASLPSSFGRHRVVERQKNRR